MDWIAYCRECGELTTCPNGAWAESEARVHHRATGHATLVGFEPFEYVDGREDLPDILTYENTGIPRPL